MVMRFIGGFFQFARRVLDSARKGGLAEPDLKKLDNLLTRTGKRNAILAKGILTSLSAGGASEKDVARFGDLLQNAETRISENKEPFTDAERKELTEIFKRAYISAKTARWFSAQIDELLAEEINEFISGKRRVEIGIPAKKAVTFETESEKKVSGEERKKKIKM
jgi:3-oxoacyl-ACP reductase-like protein